MYGHPPRSRHLRGTPVAQPPSHSPNPNIHRQDPSHHSQNPNFPLQSPNFPTQNSGVPPHHFPNRGYRSQRRSQNYEEALRRIERAVAKSRRDLHAAGESVSACKVSQDALLILQVDSWGSLGFQVQEVPSLHRLIVMEGKINAFIHCFVGARRITSLYDLEVAICKDEGIEQFEELEMGPLLRHQLVVHYFSVNSEVTCVYKITSEEIIYFLLLFKDTLKKKKYIEAEEFLDFIAMKREVVGREKLCVRIQSMGMHATFIREARASEYSTLKEFLKKCRKRTFDSTEKTHVDDFSSVQDNFGGKNTIVFSSISEDDREAHRSLDDDARPYLKGEADADVSRASSNFCNNESGQPVERIKKSENLRCATSAPVKLSKKGRVNLDHSIDDLIADNYMRIFITMLKDACQGQTIGEVLERILQFYVFSAKQIRKAKTMFSSVPYAGLLIIAVACFKCGIWDSIYDTFQAKSQPSDIYSKFGSIDVKPSGKNSLMIEDHISEHIDALPVEVIIKKVAAYFDHDREIPRNGKSLEKTFDLLKKLRSCEAWLTEKFSVREFKSLGNGEFLTFLERNASLLPNELLKCLTGETCEKSPFAICMLQHQLVVLLSQASNSLWENESITKQKISSLLVRQFPLISFDIIENGSSKDLLDFMTEQKSSVISNCVLFSVTLFGTCYIEEPAAQNDDVYEIGAVRTDTSNKEGTLGPVTFNEAVEVLLRAPMLSDLNIWSHWDLLFAPSLGSLVGWLLNEVNMKDLMCLVTKDGKVLRINPLATPGSFLEASLQGSSFQTAVELISLFSLLGGKRHVPLSLLKCHARQAFEAIFENPVETMEVNDRQNFLMHGIASYGGQKIHRDGTSNLDSELQKSIGRTSKALSVASRFIIDCLGYLPSEFRSFAAEILLNGLRHVNKKAPSAILCECTKTEERVMLHEVGLSLGIVEWIEDYHAFCSTAAIDLLNPSGTSQLKATSSGISTTSNYLQNALDNLSPPDGEMQISTFKAYDHNGESSDSEVCHPVDCMEVAGNRFNNDCMQHALQIKEHEDAALVIESIRQEEFGLGPSLSSVESCILKKQHARLGRALHCLSQELYSQDSHFLLELVQNADDNIYPENVEPTLTFILQKACVILLNNEQGFSAQNIRALCDVGNSTKKGSSAGYIGKKGIGFKSVFRVTDAPEIHSNGFHVKFDISEGQIGFVLPTVVPPCDIDSFCRLASGDTNEIHATCWNTCIVLPFGSKVSEGTSMNNILSMFSDLHPSLLLFLHRVKCIKFRNMLNNSFIVMKKEIVGNGIIKVSHGKEEMTWLVVSQKLQADIVRHDVQTTEIAIAYTLQELDKGEYFPHLDRQPVFAFLPLRTYGLKFILQGDFVLPSSREEVDGDSPWNQWLLSEFPGLFVSAESSFCELPCFRENPGKGVTAYLSFVPLVGEVHGFFSSLPRMIISKLRMSNCLLLEGNTNTWVPPCKVLRNWNEQARILLPDSLLLAHLGLGFLDKDIVLSDPLAKALGIEEYGPKILLQIISSLSCTKNGLKTLGLGWLFCFLNEVYTMSFHYSGKRSLNHGMESELLDNLRKISFVPLSDGTYGSLDDGAIWLHYDALSTGFDGEHELEAFPKLYSKLRTVSPALLSAAAVKFSCTEMSFVDNVVRMLHRIGVQQLSTHEIVKVHILPAITDDRIINQDKNLMTDYLSFLMLHLQSSCPNCRVERQSIIFELHKKIFILTNHGYKRPFEVSIHFGKKYGNPIDMNKLIDALGFNWVEVDSTYLKHPITKSVSDGLIKWRAFFLELGITDFVQTVQVEKSVIDISHILLKNMMWDRELISHGSVAKDWESNELVQLLSLLSMNGNAGMCRYLLEILDTLWDDCFSDKVTGYCNFLSNGESKPFRSSFINSICDVRWTVSSMDHELHYPKDLFYDCDTVRSVLGASAPYAVPKVKSGKLLSDIGFKTQVTLDDVLAILQVWRRSETPFRASIAQMSRFYTFIWNHMATSKQKIVEELHSGPSIFVPSASGSSNHEDLVPGVFLSHEQVYWHDLSGSMDQVKTTNPELDSTSDTHGPLSKTLCNVYPGLRDFFLNECGVNEIPPFRSCLNHLLHLSSVSSPSQSANAVFQVVLKWADGLKSGFVTPQDIVYLRGCLLKSEFTVLPTVRDKWVSLHPSFGLVCWCDDEKLSKEFRHSDSINFLFFGKLSNDDKEALKVKMHALMQTLGIPAISEVVTREAIYYGPADSSFREALVNWALPYAQRYIYNIHRDKYCQLKQSGFENLNRLRVVVVEKLFYKHVIQRINTSTKKRIECDSLLQGCILYTTEESDSHSVFMELSRLLYNGSPELPLANFLHMITTMVEAGSTENQLESFMLNSQKIQELPNEESIWSLSFEDLETSAPAIINEPTPSKLKKKSKFNSSWPPVDWQTAPGSTVKSITPGELPHLSGSSQNIEIDRMGPVVEISADRTVDNDSAIITTGRLDIAQSDDDPVVEISADRTVDRDSAIVTTGRLDIAQPDETQALVTGRLGERVAWKYFEEKAGEKVVEWVNEDGETGLPYDIVIKQEGKSMEYIEVKTTKSLNKDWFIISTREWEVAVDKGEYFSIAHVSLDNNKARMVIFKNPARLCQLGKLQLAVAMPNQQAEFSMV